MADIRINSLPSTATSFNTDDYIAIDGASAGTRKMLAANPPFSDVTLGSSGPSVKSTLSARAPRQGLVFVGSGSGFATMGSSLGTSSGTIDIVLDIPSSNPSTARGVFTVGPSTSSANFGNTLSSELRTDGKLWVTLTGATTSDYRRVESSSSLVSLFGGKKIRLTVVRDSSASTLTIYANGILLATAETTGGTAPSWSGSVTGTYFVDGGVSPSENYVGYHSLSGFYNRALSTSEVVALYEAGAPAGADYNSASNTLLNTSTALNAYSTSFTTFTGASATGFTASDSTASKSPRVIFPLSGTLVAGRRYRAKFTATLTAMSSVNLWQSDSSYAGLGNLGAVSSGSNEFTFTATSSVNAIMLLCTTDGSVGTHSVVISGMAVDTPGLLLAPDAAQAGGGLVWYDTSGNAANITLPASGVSWNVPSSRYLGGNWTTSGNLTVSGTGTSDFSGNVRLANTKAIYGYTFAGATGALISSSASDNLNVGQNNANWAALNLYGGTGNVDVYSGATGFVARFNTNGNFLLGTTTDSGNGRIQLATHTTSAGGIGFGTDTYLFRSSVAHLRLDASVGDVQFQIAKQGTLNAQFLVDGAALYLNTAQAGMKLILSSGAGVEALRLDSSQNAAFAGSVGIGTTSPQYSLQVSAPNTANYFPLTLSSGVIGTIGNTVGMIFGFTGNTYQKGAIIYESTSTNGVGKLHFALNAVENSSNVTLSDSKFVLTSSGDATFAGAIAIGNTVNTVSPTSPNRTITMVIGGTTYYIHAKTTND